MVVVALLGSLVGMAIGPAVVAAGSQPAEIDVEQPSFVSDDVSSAAEDNRTIYTVSGDEFTLDPQNFDVADVRSAQAVESGASVELNDRAGWYEVAVDEAGTYEFVFTTNINGSTEEFVTVLDVEETDYVHLTADEYAEERDEAAAWRDIRGTFEEFNLVSEDASIDEALLSMEESAVWSYFLANPGAALIADFALWATLFATRPTGFMIVGFILIALSGISAFALKRERDMRRKMPDIEDIDMSLLEAQKRELDRNLSLRSFQDLGLTDHDAQAIQEHFDVRNARQFFNRVLDSWRPTRFVRAYLGAHSQHDDVVRVIRDEAGDVVDAEIVSPDAVAFDTDDRVSTDGGATVDVRETDTVEFVDPATVDEDVIEVLDWQTLDSTLLFDDDTDASELDLPIQNTRDDDDLIQEFNIPIGEGGDAVHLIERREQLCELFIDVLGEIEASTWTDDRGKPRPDVDFIQFMVTWTTVGAEQYRMPVGHIRDLFLRSMQKLDASERMDDLTSRSQNNEV